MFKLKKQRCPDSRNTEKPQDPLHDVHPDAKRGFTMPATQQVEEIGREEKRGQIAIGIFISASFVLVITIWIFGFDLVTLVIESKDGVKDEVRMFFYGADAPSFLEIVKSE